MGERSGLRPIANNGGQPLRASERYGVKADEWDEMVDILEKAGNLLSPTSSSEEGPSIGVGVSLEGVMSDLPELFGDIGTYGLLFKLAAFVKNRVEMMQDVEERAQQVAAQVEFIQERWRYSSHSRMFPS